MDSLLFDTPSSSSEQQQSSSMVELTQRLTMQLRRAEDTCRKIEAKKDEHIAFLRQCLILTLAKEPPRALEFVLSNTVTSNAREQVECFKELLHSALPVVARPPQQQQQQAADNGSLVVMEEKVRELESRVEELTQCNAEMREETRLLRAQLRAGEVALESQLLECAAERKARESSAEEKLALVKREAEASESALRAQLESERRCWQQRTVALESRLQQEMQQRQKREGAADDPKQTQMVVEEKQEEIMRLRRRISQLMETKQPELELVALARDQAKRERVIDYEVQSRMRELEAKLREPSVAHYEYLRQAIVAFMTLDSAEQRQSLVPVLADLLDFTPEERHRACALPGTSAMAASGSEEAEGVLSAVFNAIASATTNSVVDPSNTINNTALAHRYALLSYKNYL